MPLILRALALSVLTLGLPLFQAIAQTKSSVTKEPEVNASFRDQAEVEIKTPPKSATTQATATTGALAPEQTATMLQLEDPFDPPRLRDFQWNFGIALSPYKPQGTVEVSGVGSQNLGSTGSSLMPSLSLGTLYGLTDGSMGAFEIGAEFQVGFASQKSSLTTQIGTAIDGRLNSTLFDGRAVIRWGSDFKSKLHGRIGVGVGRYSVTQTSDNSLARWSRDGGLSTFLLGADYKMSRKWLAQVNYRSFGKRGNFSSDLTVPASHIELGTQVIW